jgi:hypothetical protein
MGCTACTEPQCLYKGALYLYFFLRGVHNYSLLTRDVSWTEKRTKLSVLEDVKPKRSLEATILRLKLHYFGHVMKAKRSLERDIMLGQVEGHRKHGKPRMRWFDSIKEATGLRMEDLGEAV